ncbi:MAG: fumarate hydratase C-terminal domain-containing protein, partial [Veillonella parvula]|nr:fumarate hydratase C-terminal domain-containing protein [Veillonella parvula]
VLAATEVEKVESANWRELGMCETLWTFKVKEFGPLIVSIDADGNNYFEEKKIEYNKKKDEILDEIYKHVGFIK